MPGTQRGGPAEADGTSLAHFPTAAEWADRVVVALNKSSGERGEHSVAPYRSVRPGEARFSRDVFASAEADDGASHSIRFDLKNGRGRVRMGESEETASDVPDAPFASDEPLALEPSPRQAILDGLPTVLERLDVPGELEVSPRFSPDLEFVIADANDATWRASYDLGGGTIDGRPIDAAREPLSTRRFLLRLHLAHTYPSGFDARWAWALAVDAMFVSMVGWGVTGLLMWWQMKNVRRIGAVVLVLSGVAATAVAFGMHQSLTS